MLTITLQCSHCQSDALIRDGHAPNGKAAYVASRAPSGFRVLPCPVGSKKSSAPSSLTDHLARPGPKGFHFHDTGTRRALVVCAQKSARLLGVDCLVSPDATGSRLC